MPMKIVKPRHIDRKLWNPDILIIFSVIFTFVPAVVMNCMNYWRMGFKKLAIKHSFLLLGVLATCIAFGFPTLVLSLGYAMYMRNNQHALYALHIRHGGKKASFLIPIILCTCILAFNLYRTFFSFKD